MNGLSPRRLILQLLRGTWSSVKVVFAGREGLAMVVAILSLCVAALSLRVAKQSSESSVRLEDAAKKREQAAKLLFLTGSPSADGTSIRLRAADPNTIFRAMRIKLEYADHVSDFHLPPAADILPMDYIRPYLKRRVEYLKRSELYRDIKKSLTPPDKAVLNGSIPILIHTEYVLFGELLEDLSLYKIAFKASWSMTEPATEELHFTGIAFCSRVPLSEKKDWLAKDHVFAGVDIGGSGVGPMTIRFVHCP